MTLVLALQYSVFDSHVGCADEAMGLEDYIEPWMKGLWTVMTTSQGTYLFRTFSKPFGIEAKPTSVEPTVEAVLESTKTAKMDHLHIFYGSQTGCAESIAKVSTHSTSF